MGQIRTTAVHPVRSCGPTTCWLKRLWLSIAIVALALATASCDKVLDDRIGNLRITTEDWEPLEPRSPAADKVATRVSNVVREGAGAAIGVGDLVQLRVRTPKAATGRPQEDQEGDGWLWIGFQRRGVYEFAVEHDGIASALIGQRRGAVLQLTRARYQGLDEEGDTGYLNQLPFGRRDDFDHSLRATPSREKRAQGLRSIAVYAAGWPGREGSTIEILRVCKGEASQRLTDLVSTHPVRLAQDLGRTYISKEPRHHYVREAKWEGRCDDGATARYAFGPIEVMTPPGRPDGEWHFDKAPYQWVEERWGEVPIGVRVE